MPATIAYRLLPSTLVSLLCLLSLGASAEPGTVSPSAPGGTARVVVCPIEGMIDDGMLVLVKRAVQEAQGSQALIFQIDTPGGRVDSAIEITKVILSAGVPTVAYIQGMGAISAGAMISYSCDKIYMAPATSIGASTPVTLGGPEPSPEMTEKSMSVVLARYRALADEQGHDPLLGEAMVDPAIEVIGTPQADGSFTFIRGLNSRGSAAPAASSSDGTAKQVIDSVFEDFQKEVGPELEEVKSTLKKALDDAQEQRDLEKREAPTEQARESLQDGSIIVSRAGELLTLTTKEAETYGLSLGTAGSLEEVLKAMNLGGAQIDRLAFNLSESLFRWLTSPLISGLLLMLGFGGLYVEIRTPGFGLPGIVGLVCLGLFFGSYAVIGLADWVDLLLVLVGVALILIEVFVLPGFGLAGVAGILCLVVGLYLSMVRVPIPQYDWEFTAVRDAGMTVSVAVVTLTLLGILSWKLFPKTPMYNWLVLSEAQQPEMGYVIQTRDEAGSMVGLRGVSTSVLRPAGRGRFGDKNWDVMTRGEFIDAGRPIEIIQVEGNRYVVTELKGEGT